MTQARVGLAVLCLLLAASVAMRLYAREHLSRADDNEAREASGGTVDIGVGVSLPRAATQNRAIMLDSCPIPVSIYFIVANPYQSDPSHVGTVRPKDHVSYVYRGWKLENRFATVSFNAIYFARRAYARLTMQKEPAFDDLAVKIVVPAECNTSSDDVMAALRRNVCPALLGSNALTRTENSCAE